MSRPALQWSLDTRRLDESPLVHAVYLMVDGIRHPIASEVHSLDEPRDYEVTTRPGALTAIAFGWHVSGDTFFVVSEPRGLVVYVESWGDENEGASETSLVKVIPARGAAEAESWGY